MYNLAVGSEQDLNKDPVMTGYAGHFQRRWMCGGHMMTM
jgi:hypothetical protein